MSHFLCSINCRYFLCRSVYSNSTTIQQHEHTVCCYLFVDAMADCCCCLPLSDRSRLCFWIADPYHTVGWSTVREHGCLCSVHKVEHDFVRVHAYHTVGEGLMLSNRRGKRQRSRGCISKEEHFHFPDQSLCIVSTIQLMDNPATRRKTFGMEYVVLVICLCRPFQNARKSFQRGL